MLLLVWDEPLRIFPPYAILLLILAHPRVVWSVYCQRSQRGENTVTLKLSYILFCLLLSLFLIGVATPGFYILGALFFALCLLAWNLSLWVSDTTF